MRVTIYLSFLLIILLFSCSDCSAPKVYAPFHEWYYYSKSRPGPGDCEIYSVHRTNLIDGRSELLCDSAELRSQPVEGKILFVKQNFDQDSSGAFVTINQIWQAHEDGSSARPLSSEYYEGIKWPLTSADAGHFLLLESRPGIYPQQDYLWLMNAHDFSYTIIDSGRFARTMTAFSPDQKYITYLNATADNSPRLMMYNIQSREYKKITEIPDSSHSINLSWYDDSRGFIVRLSSNLYFVPLHGSPQIISQMSDFNCQALHPDQHRYVYESENTDLLYHINSIWIRNINGYDRRRVSPADSSVWRLLCGQAFYSKNTVLALRAASEESTDCELVKLNIDNKKYEVIDPDFSPDR